MRSSERQLLDWAGKPFGARCEGTAWDGSRLWTLDARGRRLCVIERTQASSHWNKLALSDR